MNYPNTRETPRLKEIHKILSKTQKNNYQGRRIKESGYSSYGEKYIRSQSHR